jgi:tetratricopeptide (TPR) repeat protein
LARERVTDIQYGFESRSAPRFRNRVVAFLFPGRLFAVPDVPPLVDILPTILEAARVPAPPGLPGRSLLSPADARAASYFEALSASLSRGWAPLHGVIRGKEKFIELPVAELYDLESDPAERSNRFAERKEAAKDLARLLPPLEVAARVPAAGSEEAAARLRSLGYEFLSYLEDQAGQPRRAIGTLEEARKRGYLDERRTTRLGLLCSQTGMPREGLTLLEPLRYSKNPDALNALGIARATAGQTERAVEAFEAALRLDPKNAVAWQNIGLTSLHAGKPGGALEAFDRAFALNDRLPRAWNGRGAALEELGRHGEALDSWKKAIALDPRQYEALLNLGVVAMEQGQRELARQALSRFASTAPAAFFAADIARARRLLKAGVAAGTP